MRHLSLSQGIKLAYVASFILISCVSLFLVFAVSKQIEDYIFERQLLLRIQQYKSDIQNNHVALLPAEITVHTEKAALPEQLGDYIEEEEPGVYELEHPDDEDFHYAIVALDDDQQLIFLFNVNDMELSEDIEQMVTKYILVGFVLLLLTFFAIFQLILKRSLLPMFTLINSIRSRQAHSYKDISPTATNDNELGLLQRTLSDYNRRINAFIQREREFTGFASHELRTPITVIKGALSLLELQPEIKESGKKPLARIKRAADGMEESIEMLLSLSREEHRLTSERHELNEVLLHVVDNLHELSRSEDKRVVILKMPAKSCLIEQIPGELVISNLLRNALQHGSDNEIKILNDGNQLTISNCYLEQELPTKHRNKSANFGLGTMIVTRICQNQNWDYKQYVDNGVYKVTITFH